jgi:hypothetical protein
MRFQSVEQAIRFAYNMGERAEYSSSDPLKIRGTSKEDLSPMDLHAQAAMIQTMVKRLHPAERDALLAMYGRGKDRTDAIRGLAEFIWPNLSGVLPSVRELQIVILHWATKRPSIRKIAEERGVSYRKVCGWRSSVLRAWLPYQTRGVERLHVKMFEDGDFELA